MNKTIVVFVMACVLLAIVVGMPIAHAQEVGYLPTFLMAAATIAVYTGAMIGSYIVIHESTNLWQYWTLGGYYRWRDHHAYDEHKNEFPYLFSPSPPPISKFESTCKDNINDKSSWRVHRLIGTSNHFYVWNPTNQMLTIGDDDGKSILTCYRCDSRCFNKLLQQGYKEIIKK